MNKFTVAAISAVLLAVAPVTLFAQFNSGSNGSYGPINITTSTILDVPADGVFHATTVTIAGGTLSFRKNQLNTPVYLLATGDITLNASGHISVDGELAFAGRGGVGGPGGFDGGSPSISGAPPGSGFGPGAGLAGTTTICTAGQGGAASFATVGAGGALAGKQYGTNLLLPLIGGSGGGGSLNFGGAGGGGAILIASNTKVAFVGACNQGAGFNPSVVVARGGDGTTCAGTADGSGGAIRIVAPTLTGCAQLYVNGNDSGGTGRIRIDTTDRTAMGSIGYIPGNAFVIGSFMQVFPTTLPKLDITNVAGNAIAAGTQTAVSILLPTGSPTTQPVTVVATNFVGTVPIRIVVTPETTGSPVNYDTTITIIAGQTTGSTTTNVTIPVNTPVKIHAWTR